MLAACESISLPSSSSTPLWTPAPPPDTAAPAPRFTPGDEFWFTTGDGAIVVEVFAGRDDGLLVFRRDLDHETRYMTPHLALVRRVRPFGSDRRFDPDDGRLSFPLVVGKKWHRSFRTWRSDGSRTTRRTRTCTVTGYGTIAVPAGHFAAYRVRCTLRTAGRGEAVREDLFYAPAIGRIVARIGGIDGPDIYLSEYRRAGAP